MVSFHGDLAVGQTSSIPASARLVLACALALGATVGPGRAEVVNLGAVGDNTLYAESGDLSNGAGEHVFAGETADKGANNPSALRRAVIAFDLGSIPAGSTIHGVTLTLHMSRAKETTGYTVSLHRLTSDWGEGTSDAEGEEGQGAPATSGDATWTHAFYSSTAWATPGGDDEATASAALTVGGTGSYQWSSAVSPALASDVGGWLAGTFPNHGWLLIGDEAGSRTVKRFDSRENATAADRPVLTVDFTPPVTTGACCDGAGGCTLTTFAECTGTYQGDGTSCATACTGACCLGDGSCLDAQTLAACGSAGGTFQGEDSLCSEVTCAAATGACCIPGDPGSCVDAQTEAECDGQGGTFQGEATDCQIDLCPFVDPLPRPSTAVPDTGSPGGEATYTLVMTELDQQLHRDLPPTRVWGYGGSFPGPVIEAATGQPVTVTWSNDLRDELGNLRTDHYLPVDTCPHGPGPGVDEPRTVVHLHGGHVPAEFDGHPEATFLPGAGATYVYPNQQIAAPLWYHDHALGITRLNVYMGLAGLYTLRDGVESALNLPAGSYEVPLVLQDRQLAADGALVYPALWQGHFFGDRILVNGKVWPYLEVDPGKYRFRLVNGSNSRVYTLTLEDDAGAPVAGAFQVIGGDGGLLTAPVARSAVTLGPGERMDLVVDFAPFTSGDRLHLVNSAPAPFPGTPGVGVVDEVMELRVGASGGHGDPLPATLRTDQDLPDEGEAVLSRQLVLTKEAGDCSDDIWLINGLRWDDVTEMPVLGTTETWGFVNRTGVIHPMHMHLVLFKVLGREAFTVDGNGDVVPSGVVEPPPAEESGLKDTVLAYPDEITWVVARFEDYTGRFPYHCHVLEHEDHEMMRQFEVVGPVRVAKQTVPDGYPGSFAFSGAVSGNLSDGQVLDSGALGPGAHQVSESVPANWELREVLCDDDDSSGSVATATATYQLTAGESVTCTFTNCILQLDLPAHTVTGSEAWQACDRITAGTVEVAATGDLTLTARNLVILGDGFSVATGGRLTVGTDPGL